MMNVCVINRPSSTDSVRYWLLAIVLNQPIARRGGKASLVISSRKNVSEAERNVLLLSRAFCRANSNHRQSGLGVPSLRQDAVYVYLVDVITICFMVH